MAVTEFEAEIDLGPIANGTLAGGITDLRVEEYDAAGNTKASKIIRTDQDWVITVNWELVGTMLDSPFFTIPGNWIVTAYLEGWGQNAPELELQSDRQKVSVMADKTVVPVGGGVLEPEWHYEETFNIGPVNNPPPGPYKLVITITYEDENGVPGPMAGFLEAEMLQIYKPN